MFREKIFFIIGCPRSGTTGVTKILNTATNAEIFSEQEPKLCIDSRDLYKNKINNPLLVIKELKEKPIKSTLEKNMIYGDKNPNYLPFIPYLYSLWNPKFIFILRDGREVVRSLMEWHEFSRGNIFGMREDDPNSHIESPEEDWWDYSRLRPNRNDRYYQKWKNLSRFEKCSWYWNEFNSKILKYMSKIDKKQWMLININKITSIEFKEIFNFLNLKGFNAEKIKIMFDSRINSLMDKFGKKNNFPHWTDWNNNLLNKFYKNTQSMMEKFNYLHHIK